MNDAENGFLREGPVIVVREPLKGFCDRVSQWLESERKCSVDPEKEGGRVIGLWGPRGSGKTSALLTLMHLLRLGGSSWCLPASHRVFSPSDLGGDDLHFALLSFLETEYERVETREKPDAFFRARRALVRRSEKPRFMDIEKELAPSTEQLPRRFVRIQQKIAETGKELRERFEGIVTSILNKKGKEAAFVLPVDDLDLAPDKTLEVLETLRLYLDLPRVFVIIAADRELLLDSLRWDLERSRHIEQPGLSAAFVAKHIHQTWTLPIPDPQERLQLLLHPSRFLEEAASSSPSSKVSIASPLKALIPPSLVDPWNLMVSRLEEDARQWKEDQDRRRASGQPLLPDSERPLPPPPAADVDELRKHLLMPKGQHSLLPPSYRGLKQVHNRLLTLWQELKQPASDKESYEAYRKEALRRYPDLLSASELLPVFLALCACLDTQYPELGLSPELERHSGETATALREFLSRPSDASLREHPVLDALLGDRLAPRHAGYARALLRQLAIAIRDWREPKAPLPSPTAPPPALPTLEPAGTGTPPLLSAPPSARSEAAAPPDAAPTHVVPSRLELLLEDADPPPSLPRSGKIFVILRLLAERPSREWARAAWTRAGYLDEQVVDLDLRSAGTGLDPATLEDAQRTLLLRVQELEGPTPRLKDMTLQTPLSFALWCGLMWRHRSGLVLHQAPQGTNRFIPYPLKDGEIRPDLERTTRFSSFDREVVPRGEGRLVLLSVRGRPEDAWHERVYNARGQRIMPDLITELTRDPRRVTADNLHAMVEDMVTELARVRASLTGPEWHLCIRMPLELAFALGRQMHQFAPVKLYEQAGADYRYVFDLLEPK